jgi:hypothetical protein
MVGVTVESLTNKLAHVVSQEVKQFELFLSLLADQQNYLVNNDVDNIARVVKEQEKAILETKELERARLRILEEISQSSGKDVGDLSLSEIAKRLSKPQAERLRKMQKTLLDLHSRVKKAKARNEFLIKKSMEYIEETVQLLASSGVQVPTYAEKGPGDRTSNSFMVNRTA